MHEKLKNATPKKFVDSLLRVLPSGTRTPVSNAIKKEHLSMRRQIAGKTKTSDRQGWHYRLAEWIEGKSRNERRPDSETQRSQVTD